MMPLLLLPSLLPPPFLYKRLLLLELDPEMVLVMLKLDLGQGGMLGEIVTLKEQVLQQDQRRDPLI